VVFRLLLPQLLYVSKIDSARVPISCPMAPARQVANGLTS